MSMQSASGLSMRVQHKVCEGRLSCWARLWGQGRKQGRSQAVPAVCCQPWLHASGQSTRCVPIDPMGTACRTRPGAYAPAAAARPRARAAPQRRRRPRPHRPRSRRAAGPAWRARRPPAREASPPWPGGRAGAAAAGRASPQSAARPTCARPARPLAPAAPRLLFICSKGSGAGAAARLAGQTGLSKAVEAGTRRSHAAQPAARAVQQHSVLAAWSTAHCCSATALGRAR